MKNIYIILWIIVVGRVSVGCSDDGVYTPVEPPPPVSVCDEKDEVCDAGPDADPILIPCEAGPPVMGHDADTTTCN